MRSATTSSGVEASTRLRRVFFTSVLAGVVHPEVQPRGKTAGHHGQRQNIDVTGWLKITGLCWSNHGTP